MSITYDHSRNSHSVTAAQEVMPLVIEDLAPASVLDVGCGIGTWLVATRALGVPETQGIDGIDLRGGGLLVPPEIFSVVNLEGRWDLRREFDLAICLEVAEHLPASAAATLIECLCRHSRNVLFSAAAPSQPGQSHINCQWPEYWQELFNLNGFTCVDSIRPRIWFNEAIDPWYRQNVFLAQRDRRTAGSEVRIRGMIHPAMMPHLLEGMMRDTRDRFAAELSSGDLGLHLYVESIRGALKYVVKRTCRRLGVPTRNTY